MSTLHIVNQYKLDILQERINTLSRKAVKLGLPPLTCNIVDSETKEHKDSHNRVFRFTEYLVEVDGISPIINGWTLLAKIESFSEHGNIIRTFSDEDLSKYRNSDQICQHCGKIRTRNNTYILSNNETGERLQVGSSCLIDFLGHASAEKIAEFYASFDIEAILNSEDQSEPCERFGHGNNGYALFQVVAYAMRSIASAGYVKSNDEGLSTKFDTVDRFSNDTNLTEEEEKTAKTIIEVVKSDLISRNSDLNNYEWNLSAIIETGFVTYSQMGYAVSIVPFYSRLQEKTIAANLPKEQRQESNWIGEIGGKMSNLNVTLVSYRVIERERYSYYDSGISHLYKFVDNSGNVLVWFASNVAYAKNDEMPAEEGQNFIMTRSTVKNHDAYGNVKQTVVKLCKLERVY